MTREELHKAAEEMYLKKTGWESFSDIEEWTDPSETVELMVKFHLHQTKKMLEGWTDDRIYEFANEKYSLIQDKVACKWNIVLFRDELLKQLGNEKTT